MTTVTTLYNSIDELDRAGLFLSYPEIGSPLFADKNVTDKLIELGDTGSRTEYITARQAQLQLVRNYAVAARRDISTKPRTLRIGNIHDVHGRNEDGTRKRIAIHQLQDLSGFENAMTRHQYSMNTLIGVELICDVSTQHHQNSIIHNVAGLPANFAGANLTLKQCGPESLLVDRLPRHVLNLTVCASSLGDMSCFVKHFETFKTYNKITIAMPKAHEFFGAQSEWLRPKIYDNAIHSNPLDRDGVMALLELTRHIDVGFYGINDADIDDFLEIHGAWSERHRDMPNVRRLFEYQAIAEAVGANFPASFDENFRPQGFMFDDRRKKIMSAMRTLQSIRDTY
jgi:hypothetical protein